MVYRFYLNELCTGDVVYTITKKGDEKWDKERFGDIEGTSRHRLNRLEYEGKKTIRYYKTASVFDYFKYSEAELPPVNLHEKSPPTIVGSGDSQRSIYRQNDKRKSDQRDTLAKIEIVGDKTKMTWMWKKNNRYFYSDPIEDDDVYKETFTKQP